MLICLYICIMRIFHYFSISSIMSTLVSESSSLFIIYLIISSFISNYFDLFSCYFDYTFAYSKSANALSNWAYSFGSVSYCITIYFYITRSILTGLESIYYSVSVSVYLFIFTIYYFCIYGTLLPSEGDLTFVIGIYSFFCIDVVVVVEEVVVFLGPGFYGIDPTGLTTPEPENVFGATLFCANEKSVATCPLLSYAS